MPDASSVGFDREDLESLTIFRGMPDEQLDWFCRRGERVALRAGEEGTA